MATKSPLLLYFALFLLAGCQGSKSAFQPRPADVGGAAVLLHDSQSPEPTRVPREAWEADEAAPVRGEKRP